MELSPKPFPFILLLLLFSLVSISQCRVERSSLKIRGGGPISLISSSSSPSRLRFGKKDGEFKILQVADMHYANGRSTWCQDVSLWRWFTCSDLDTGKFLNRVIEAEKPDLVVFTGDNIYGKDSTDPGKSMNMAFAPAISLELPWAAILGNHDQEGSLSREDVMQYIVGMPHTLSELNPLGVEIDGYGNYYLKVAGAEGSSLANKSVLNLYFLDSGDYSKDPSVSGYDWIKRSQQIWFQNTAAHLQEDHPAPALAYFHIPLPEFKSFDASNFTGVKQESISSPSINSGFFKTMVEAEDVKAVFIGHDHVNDFCGKLAGIQLCYAGGFGYHAYGKVGWSRRARVVSVYLEKNVNGEWGEVESIKTWKRLDDEDLSTIDSQVLWNEGSRKIE